MHPPTWGHVAREAARLAVIRSYNKERNRQGKPLGLSGGVRREETLRWYKKADAATKGILRKILCGDVWPNTGRAHAFGDTPACSCGAPREDLVHLWWKCPRWNHLRPLVLAALDPANLPTALALNGLAVDDTSAAFVEDAQRMFAAIYRERFL